MKSFVIAVALTTLAACGVETATTAATGAATKKQEIEEGQKTLDRARNDINAAMEKAQERAKQADGN
jgi:hypothetical protein